MDNITEQIKRLELENEVLTQLQNLKSVLDIYEKNLYPAGSCDEDLFEIKIKNNITKEESLKMIEWVIENKADVGTEQFERLTERLRSLDKLPERQVIVKICYHKAKERYNNLLAFKQLKKI